MNIARALIFILFVFMFSWTTFSQAKTPVKRKIAPVSAKAVRCSSGAFSFKCPEGYAVSLRGNNKDRLFFAKSREFPFGVFAVVDPESDTIATLIPKLLKVFEPNESQDFQWKDVEADPRKSSKYEVESKRRIGMNGGKAYITLEYRKINFQGKKLLTGTIVNGYEGPIGIKESFENGDYTANGGCFDSVDIIAAFTKEKLDPEEGPCVMKMTISPIN